MKTHIVNTAYILVLASLGYFATDVYLPSLPKLSEYFSASENEVQMTLFFYMLSFSATPLVFGPLSDHYGRKKVIVFGLLVSLVSTLSCVMATSIFWLILSRFVQGAGTGAVMIAARSMTGDLYQGVALAKQISNLTMFMPFVLAFAPTVGGILQDLFGWQAVFYFLLCYLVIIGISLFFLRESKETLSDKKLSEIFSGYWQVIRHRSFVFSGIGMALPSIGLFAYLTSSPFIFQELIGLTPAEYGSLAIFIGGAIMLSSFINLRLLHRFKIDTLLWAGTCLMIAGGFLMMLFHVAGLINTWTVLVPSLLFFGCVPFSIGNSASKAISQVKGHIGSANGLLTSAQFVAGALGSFIFSLVEDSSAFPLALCFLVLGFSSLFVLCVSGKSRKLNP